MIKARMVKTIWGPLELEEVIKDRLDKEKQLAIKKTKEERLKKIDERLKELRDEYRKVIYEKALHDKKMDVHIEEVCRPKQALVDDYTRQISKLEVALQICKKALSQQKKEVATKWKEENPFDDLKKIQNRISDWERRKYNLK